MTRRAPEWAGVARSTRLAAILPAAERPAAVARIAGQVAAMISAAVAYGELPSAATMRALGGFSAVIRRVLGPKPPALPNEIGVATNPDFYRYEYLAGRAADIRNAAISLVHWRQEQERRI